MTLNVMNCVTCGKLSIRTPDGVCPACLKDLERQCLKCIEYLRDHRGTTLQELSEATGVAKPQIMRFIREGRLTIAKSSGFTYPCESCGEPIQVHTLCDSCRTQLNKELNQSEKLEQIRQELKQQQGNQITYKIKDRLDNRR